MIGVARAGGGGRRGRGRILREDQGGQLAVLLEQTGQFTIQGRGLPADTIFELYAERIETFEAARTTGAGAEQSVGQAGGAEIGDEVGVAGANALQAMDIIGQTLLRQERGGVTRVVGESQGRAEAELGKVVEFVVTVVSHELNCDGQPRRDVLASLRLHNYKPTWVQGGQAKDSG